MTINKKQTRSDPLKYRHISLTPVTCKSMERLLATNITNCLSDNDNLFAHLFEFCAAHSTVDHLLETNNDITLMIDEREVVDPVFLTSVKPLIWCIRVYL